MPAGTLPRHLQLVSNIFQDGSLQNLVFSNGSVNTDYLQQNKEQVVKLIAGSDSYRKMGGAASSSGSEDGQGDEGDEEDDEEHIIVTMLRSMNTKKLETCQLADFNCEIDVEKIRHDLKVEYFKEIQKKMDSKI